MVWEERWHPLREEWVVVAAHRQNRPWNGETVEQEESALPDYLPDCYLCPGNTRVSGKRNDNYKDVFVFDKDNPCVGFDEPSDLAAPPGVYLISHAAGHARGICLGHTTHSRHRPRRLLHPAPQPDPRRSRYRGDRQPDARLAVAIRRTRRPQGDQPRPDLREQGRSRRRLQPASALSDLRDQLRL